MISRNGPCPCGSGKKFKRCCGIDSRTNGKDKNPLGSFDTLDIIQTIAALTLVPGNHGKNLRLEKVAVEAVTNLSKSTKKIPVGQLAQFLKAKYAADANEDLPGSLFTEVIAFHGGDHLILPGITESPAFFLNSLLSAIYNWPNTNLNPYFKSNCSHAAHALLLISDSMLRKAGCNRYMIGKSSQLQISFPSPVILSVLKNAVFFSKEELDALFAPFNIDKRCLSSFTTDIHDPAFKAGHVDESPLIEKPLILMPGGWLVASPATLSYALISAIKSLADQWKCTDEMHDAYHALVWNNTLLNLKRLNFIPVDISGIYIPENSHIKTFFGGFDDNKIAVIQYLAVSQAQKLPSPELLVKQRKALFEKIITVPGYEDYEFMDLTLPSSLCNEVMLPMWGNDRSKTLMINTHELDIVAKSHKSCALDLWKFAIAREQQVPNPMKFVGLSFLDEYTAYKSHSDSFYLSDEGFDISQWMYGQSQSFIEEAKLREDEHCMAIRIGGRLAKTLVTRRSKYSPIYISLMGLASNDLQFAIEGLGPSVWVMPLIPADASAEARHMFWELTDTLAYWLWQLTEDIKKLLSSIDTEYIGFSFELDDIQKFEAPDDDFTRDNTVYHKLNVSSSSDTIHLVIPSEIMAYFYGPDNEGDRILVRQLLYGINDLLLRKNLPPLSEQKITAILEKEAPLGLKKKLIIHHSRSNMLLDRSNLVERRYVQDFDNSTIANSIVKLLDEKCPPVGEVVDIEDKKQLTKNIVIHALLPLLKKTIALYDSEELIKRLIALNESLINDRERQRLKTPTRIACFVSVQQHTEDLLEIMAEIDRTTIALRCLLEHLAAEPSKGIKPISNAAIDELIAIMDAIIGWGSLGDQLTFNLFDIRLGVLPTGRIGTQKTVSREIFDPYHHSKTSETVYDAIASFEQEFPIDKSEKNIGGVSTYLDKAFEEEFNISFTRICIFIDLLAGLAFQQKTPYAVMDKKKLLTHAETYVSPFTRAEFNSALEFLGLGSRGDVKTIPKGYEGYDISPWRFNRRLSLLRRPLIILETPHPDNPVIYWGARQVLVSRMNLAEQCQHDRMKVNDKGPVKRAMSRLSNDRGTGLVRRVLEELKLPDVVLDWEVTISPKGKLNHGSDIGDIDVLLIDLNSRTLYSLECKYFAPSRNIKEMIEECEKLLGSRSEKGLIEKHTIRDEWIKKNLKQIGLLYKQNLSGFAVKSIMVTRESMLFPYLTTANIKMPFVTLYELEKEGVACLNK